MYKSCTYIARSLCACMCLRAVNFTPGIYVNTMLTTCKQNFKGHTVILLGKSFGRSLSLAGVKLHDVGIDRYTARVYSIAHFSFSFFDTLAVAVQRSTYVLKVNNSRKKKKIK